MSLHLLTATRQLLSSNVSMQFHLQFVHIDFRILQCFLNYRANISRNLGKGDQR